MSLWVSKESEKKYYVPHHKQTCHWGFWPVPLQTRFAKGFHADAQADLSLRMDSQNEPCCDKTNVLHMQKTKTQISFVITAKLISTFVFRNLDSIIPLLPKYKISSLEPSPVAVQPGLCQTRSESTLLVFSCCSSNSWICNAKTRISYISKSIILWSVLVTLKEFIELSWPRCLW